MVKQRITENASQPDLDLKRVFPKAKKLTKKEKEEEENENFHKKHNLSNLILWNKTTFPKSSKASPPPKPPKKLKLGRPPKQKKQAVPEKEKSESEESDCE